MGGLVFRQRADGTTIVSAAPEFKDRKFSEKQLAHQSHFKQASAYATEAAKTEPIYADLAERMRTSAYQVALTDRLNAPAIHGVERRGGHIDIYATDDVQVTKVYVTISNDDGVTLEQGSATLVQDGWWEYETEVYGNVLVEAYDLAGNITRQEA